MTATLDATARLRGEILSGAYENVTELDISSRGLVCLPDEICTLTHLTKINAANNELSDLPRDFANLSNLRTLFFLGNAFTSVPTVLGKLPHLFMLSFKSCRLVDVPGDTLSASIGWLILTDNKLTSLPREIGSLKLLRKCMLASNLLREIPDEICGCESLELLRLSDNRLTSVPAGLLTLPKLAWIALAGNLIEPRSREAELDVAPSLRIAPSALMLGKKLGDGASGIVYQAELRPENASHDESPAHASVAVKVYKPASSDGRVVDEVAAVLALAGAADHPGGAHLIRTVGIVENGTSSSSSDGALSPPLAPASPLATSAAPALVMELLDSESMRLLGGTPSFASVTRDVYAPGTAFTPAQALSIARGVAGAVAAMHAAGVAHGDVYAHNTLVGTMRATVTGGDKLDSDADSEFTAKLGDFGAAYFLPPPSAASAAATATSGGAAPPPSEDPAFYLRRLESRALGCLLEELLQRVTGDPPVPCSGSAGQGGDAGGHRAAATDMQRLLMELARARDDCLQPQVALRPEPAQVFAFLRGFKL